MFKMVHLKNWFKSLSTFKIILILRMLSGYCQYRYPNKRYAVLANLWCFLFSVSLTTYMSISLDHSQIFYQISFLFRVTIIDFLSHVIVSALSRERYLFKYFNVLKSIDASMKWKISRDTDFANIIHIVHVIYVCVQCITFKFQNDGGLQDSTFHCINLIIVCLSFGYSPKLMIYESFWKRMRLLREWVEQRPEADRSWVWKKTLYTYKHLLDNIQRTNKIVKLTMVLEMPMAGVRMLTISYFIISILLFQDSLNVAFFMLSVQFLITFFAAFSPAIQLELVAFEHEQLLSLLAQDLLYNSDANSRYLLQEVFQYLEERPPRYSLYRVVPLDASLLTIIAGLCSTYTIVLLQFHK